MGNAAIQGVSMRLSILGACAHAVMVDELLQQIKCFAAELHGLLLGEELSWEIRDMREPRAQFAGTVLAPGCCEGAISTRIDYELRRF
jgi:hypothetical protein